MCSPPCLLNAPTPSSFCQIRSEVPIGIPMPAAYVEMIKYALGDQVGALAERCAENRDLESPTGKSLPRGM